MRFSRAVFSTAGENIWDNLVLVLVALRSADRATAPARRSLRLSRGWETSGQAMCHGRETVAQPGFDCFGSSQFLSKRGTMRRTFVPARTLSAGMMPGR